MAHRQAETNSGAAQDARDWLRHRLTWERRLTDLRLRAGRVPGDALAARRDVVEVSPRLADTRLPAAS